MAGIAASMVEQLGEQAGGLARVSASLVIDRVSLPGDGEKLKDTQEQLNEEIEKLLEALIRQLVRWVVLMRMPQRIC